MEPKRSQIILRGAPFSILFRRGSFVGPLGSFWLPFGSLLAPFGSILAPFCTLSTPFLIKNLVFLVPEFANHLQIAVGTTDEGNFSLASCLS